MTYTTGEDGHVRAWKIETSADETMDIDEEADAKKKKDKKDRKEKRKEKKDKKEKKRYEPY